MHYESKQRKQILDNANSSLMMEVRVVWLLIAAKRVLSVVDWGKWQGVEWCWKIACKVITWWVLKHCLEKKGSGWGLRCYRATRIARDGTIARRQDDCPPATPVQTLGGLGLELELPAPSCRGASTSINKNRKDIWNYHGFRLENIPIPKD